MFRHCVRRVPQDPFPTGLATKPSKDAASCGNQAAIAEQLRLLQRPSRRRISRFVEPLHAAAPFRRAALTAAGVAALALCSLRHVRAQTSPPAPCVLRVRGAFFRFASAVDYNLFGIASRWRMCGRSPLCRRVGGADRMGASATFAGADAALLDDTRAAS